MSLNVTTLDQKDNKMNITITLSDENFVPVVKPVSMHIEAHDLNTRTLEDIHNRLKACLMASEKELTYTFENGKLYA